jgi:F1F0 ATPase subunit 2
MNEVVTYGLILLIGIVLGTLFFGGLWWTILKGTSSKRPEFWFLGSFIVRTSIVLVGFYFVLDGRWNRLVVCLLGFIIARFILMHRFRLVQKPNYLVEEDDHAS